MKELEKTRRISISAVLFLLVIVIGLLTFKKPEFNFTKSSESALEFISNQDHILSLADFQKLDPNSYLLIDVRSHFDYSKGHMDRSLNMPKNQLLNSEVKTLIQTALSNEKVLILYGEDPENANAASMLLFQLGYTPIKLLSIESFYDDKEFHIKSIEVEKPLFDYSETMKKASTPFVKKVAPKVKTQPAKKKVVPKPKKKKKMPEGGC